MSCNLGRPTLFIRMPELISACECKETPGQKARLIHKLSKLGLLVLDEWLSDTYPDQVLSFLFEVIEKREHRASTILCSQFPPETWMERLGRSSKAESLPARICAGMCRIECKGLDIIKLDCCKVKILRCSSPSFTEHQCYSYGIGKWMQNSNDVLQDLSNKYREG